jgi:hypothetical protein
MSMIGYEVPIDWIPDEDYINVPPDYEYLAWRLGTNDKAQTALWVITPVAETPTVPLVDLLPVGYVEVLIDSDTSKYGYTRDMYPKSSISEVEEIITINKAYVTNELL